jgi:uncharacterized protein (DUF1684 family)
MRSISADGAGVRPGLKTRPSDLQRDSTERRVFRPGDAGDAAGRRDAAGRSPASSDPATLIVILAVMFLALAAAGCTSGPSIDNAPYARRIEQDRRDKDEAFRLSPGSPIPTAERASFTNLVYFPIDPAYKVPAYLTEDRTGPPVIIELETSKGQRDRLRKVGSLGFTLSGATHRLTAFADAKAATVDRLFVPFGDSTNDAETYGGGRYLDLQRTATGLYDLDFNRAYNPYCVYNYEYECPVPPKENRLPLAIRAGEKMKAK